MARMFLLFIGLVATASACTSSSGRTPAWDLGPNTEIYPTYEDGAVGIGIEHRFKRSTDESTKKDFFSLLDTNGDGYMTFEEWHSDKGSLHDFAQILEDLDKNDDEKISLEEFEAVKDVVYKTNH